MNENRNAAIVELVRSGKKQADVARALGISRERVRQICMAAELDRGERTHFTKDEIDLEAIHQRNVNGETIHGIAKLIGVRHASLYQAMIAAGYEIIKQPYRWTAARRSEIEADYLSGLTQVELGKKYGITQRAVSQLFIRYGLATRLPGRRNNARRHYESD